MKKLNKIYRLVGYLIGGSLAVALLAGSVWIALRLIKAVFNLF